MHVSTVLLAFILGIVAWVSYAINKYNKNIKKGTLVDEIYGKKPLPFIGNIHQLALNPGGFFDELYDIFEKSGYTTIKFLAGSNVLIFLCDPETVEVLLSSTKEINKTDEYVYFRDWLGEGLTICTGAKWRQRRKIVTPAFYFNILVKFVGTFNEKANDFVESLSEHTGKIVDMFPLANHFALDVICETAMGISINRQEASNTEYINAVHNICKLLNSRLLSFWKRNNLLYRLSSDYAAYNKCIKTLHTFTNNVIKKRRDLLKDEIENVKNGNVPKENEEEFSNKRKKIAFLDLLLLTKLPDGSFLSDEDIREETETFMFGGHDTTTIATIFALYLMANDLDVQQKALEEVLSIVGGQPTKEITYEQLQNMKYMEMVIKETLRLYPPVPQFGRFLESDLVFANGKIIPAGCQVYVSAYLLGRNPRHYPDVEKFNPERFSLDNTCGKNPFMSVPFSAGSRNCLGQKFAMLEIKSVLAKVLMNYELSSAGKSFEPKLVCETNLKSANGVHLVLKKRQYKN